ncbi:MAG TPA: PSD1 and planctomycete cytochrome C domain-containing protein [Isosphaeraceae bacterium]|jgi:mono/diheme cytochrome c family protein|nr:PSD1 and planctomycete cytochrome C domain-containing protein [Isosphaeraceae bacterium]
MARAILLIAVAALGAAPDGEPKPGPKADPARIEFFEAKVRPVLAANCVGCHGPDKQKAGLRLDSRAAILQGGDSGPAVQPGEPEQSLLVEVIRYNDEPRMPPKARLKDVEIAALTRWVADGLPWPDAGPAPRPTTAAATATVTAEDRSFWSFRPVRDVPPPAVRDGHWPKSDIDRFILAKLEEKGLQPVGPADKRTLIRRATFDLTGLPPSSAEIDAFLGDDSPDAFARVVDRLLASPHYGERWGRHWLDVARYGEDQAHTFEARLYPDGWRYRDWVVRAFNDDMPYDRFVTDQVAGDLIDGPGRDDRLAALGFFALGPVYYGKAVFDEYDDRVDTLCRGFLGLTVACARCHDHKYDPIPQKDYYSLAGVFSSTTYREYPHAPPEVVERYDRAQEAIKAKTGELAAFLRAESARWSEAATADTAKYMVASWSLVNRRRAHPKLATAEFAKGEGVEALFLDRWVKFLFPEKDADRPHLARWRAVIAGQDKAKDLSGDESAKAEVAEAARAFQDYVRATISLRDALKAQGAAATANAAGDEKQDSKALELPGPEATLLRELVAEQGVFGLARNDVERRLPAEAKAALKSRRDELNRLKKEMPPKYPVVHSLAEGPSPANMRVHIRGNPSTLGDEAPRRFLAILSADGTKPFTRGSGRLELAEAIASKDNPLTARVLVNRVWAHHFGRGLVGTPSNFGRLGEQPTHPELLDHLAARFVASGWSIKTLHRMILLSATYQLAVAADSKAEEVDPDNRLLWRANRRRLEVESWRDAMLAVSGELDRTIGGPPAPLTSAENRRRTLYAAISRHNLDGLLRLFDFPDPNLTSDKRAVTTVPLQQLFVLNSPFMERQARALVARLASDPAATDEDRIRRAFPLLFGRPATDDEVRLGLSFLAAPEAGRPSRWEQYAQALLAANEFLYLD